MKRIGAVVVGIIVVLIIIVAPVIFSSRKRKTVDEKLNRTTSVTYASSTTSPANVTINTTLATTLRPSSNDTTVLLTAMYVADLNVNSRIICDRGACDEKWYYAEFVLVTVPITGSYAIHAESARDTYGYLYQMPFDIRFFNFNLLDKDDDSYGNSQFQLASTLQSNQTYVVLVTTFSPSALCTVNLYGVGPGLLNFSRFTNLTDVNFRVQVNYSSSLERTSPMFCRNGTCANATHYYRTFVFNTSASGTHIIGSASSLDTYALLYNGTFNPLDPRENLISEDDDGLGNNQFGLAIDLRLSVRYIVVATTFAGNRRGNFTLLVYAPGTVSIS